MFPLFIFQLLLCWPLPVAAIDTDAISLGSPVLEATRNSTTPISQLVYGYANNNRPIRQTIWSCLSVIFACTWTAVHPNVYGYRSTAWQRTKRRTSLFLLALFMPEVNLVWSIQQWRGARKISKRMAAERHKINAQEAGMDHSNGTKNSSRLYHWLTHVVIR